MSSVSFLYQGFKVRPFTTSLELSGELNAADALEQSTNKSRKVFCCSRRPTPKITGGWAKPRVFNRLLSFSKVLESLLGYGLLEHVLGTNLCAKSSATPWDTGTIDSAQG